VGRLLIVRGGGRLSVRSREKKGHGTWGQLHREEERASSSRKGIDMKRAGKRINKTTLLGGNLPLTEVRSQPSRGKRSHFSIEREGEIKGDFGQWTCKNETLVARVEGLSGERR